MYADFFQFRELPFRLSPDLRFNYVGAVQQKLRNELRITLPDGDGAVLLCGDAGVGKTLLAQDVLREMGANQLIVQIRNPEIGVMEFYQSVLLQLDDRTPPTARAALLASFDTCLAREAAMRRTVVVFVDNAELMAPDLMDEILRLSKRSLSGKGNLRVLMAGRPAVLQTLEILRRENRPARVECQLMLPPLSDTDISAYLQCRVEAAGRVEPGLFDTSCIAEFLRYTGGVPKLINILADAALVVAFNRNGRQVALPDVRHAAAQLNWVEYRHDEAAQQPVPATMGEGRGQSTPDRIGHLRIEHAGQVVAEFDLPPGKLTIGRATANDVRIESQFISRHHCQILTTGTYSVIEDLQSQNGLLVESRRVSVHRLLHGDQVVLGEHVLFYSKRQPETIAASSIRPPMTLVPSSTNVDGGATRVLSKSASECG